MNRWSALELLVPGVTLFAYFVPVLRISRPPNCVFCPIEPQFGSLTYALLGHGEYYVGIPMSGYYSVMW